MGNNTTKLINDTGEVMEIREFRGIPTGENISLRKITVNAGQNTDIDATKFGGMDSLGGQLSDLKIFCGGSFLRSLGKDWTLPGDQFIHFETVTIVKTAAKYQNSTGVVNYKVEFKPRDASKVSAKSFEVYRDLVSDHDNGSRTETPHAGIRQASRDSVLDHDNGWSVQHFENGSVKLTREEGMTMTLDPSKLFDSNIVSDPETVLLHMVLKFWPRIFADLNCKDDLGGPLRGVNDLLHQAKLYNVDQSNDELIAKVEEKVREFNNLRTAKVEWYRPLFPGMKDRFPPVAETMAEVDQEKKKFDQEKLEVFETAIGPLLR